MAHEVLISYSNQDKLQADATCNRLESQGIRCWIAPRDVPLGTEYADSIMPAIEAAKIVVLIYSSNAEESHQVKREIERAVSKGVTIVPVRIEDAPMSKSMEYFVSSMHWLDAITPPLEDHIDKLAHDLKTLLAKDGEVKAKTENRTYESVVADIRETAGGSSKSLAGAVQTAPTPPVMENRHRRSQPSSPKAAASPQRKPRPAIIAAAVGVLLCIAAIAVYFKWGSIFQNTLVVPNVSGKSEQQAREMLAEYDLNVDEVKWEESEMDYGLVIGTDPKPGDPAKKNNAVTLYVFGMVILPLLVDKPKEYAESMLKERGLGALVEYEPHQKEKGIVIRTNPIGGERILKGKQVTLYVAEGKVSIPNVVKMEKTKAQQILIDSKLQSEVFYDWNPKYEINTVFQTDPGADQNVMKGTKIKLSVSATGGWIYPGGSNHRPGTTFSLTRGQNLRKDPSANTNGNVTKTLYANQSVRVLEARKDGWVKIVVVD